jgi:predicted ribosome quality control (RQC) complex YloA/Tae2 family protein
MTTDWLVVRRMAVELNQRLKGGRVTDVGLLDDGRIAVRFGGLRGGGATTLALDPFASPPLVALVDAEPAAGTDPGWLRAANQTLRGMRVGSVQARRGDRVIAVAFGSLSRFGVGTEARLVAELVPRFGNVLVLKDGVVVGAAKQFGLAENSTRSVLVGERYTPPPLPLARMPRTVLPGLLPDDPAKWSGALGDVEPLIPKLVAQSFVAEAQALPWPSKDRLAAWLLEKADRLLSNTQGEPDGIGEVFVYRRAGALVQAHIVPLKQFADCVETREAALLPLLAAERDARVARAGSDGAERKRHALLTQIAKRRAQITDELPKLRERYDDAAGRDALRAAGDALYTHITEVPARAATFVPPTNPELTVVLDPELDAKENAAAYYARYKKAANALPHLERRIAVLAALESALDGFAFEAERADPSDLDDLATDFAALEQRKAAAVAPRDRSQQQRKRRATLQIDRPSGARIYVGRSPRENVEITFKIAKPDDLWFHVRNQPGSHVVVHAPSGVTITDDDKRLAAAYAARHSRAKTSDRVEVDYTERKFVRKQRDGGPGQVWYTNAKTIAARPSDIDLLPEFSAK